MTQPPHQPNTPRRPPTIPYAGRNTPGTGRNNPELKSGSGQPAPPPPPATPRKLTSAVRWRSWQEPRVRFWWLATLAMLAIYGWFVVIEAMAYQREQRLITTGTKIDAKIDHIADTSRTSYKVPPDTPCALVFDWNGQSIMITDAILDVSNGMTFIHPGQIVPIHVNPNDPTEWTDSTQAEPIARRLVAASVIVPIALATLVATLLLRHKILRTWRDGIAMPYSVENIQRGALAPLSHVVRCVPIEERQTRIVTVYLPGSLPKPTSGDVIWLVYPRGHSSAAIPAAAYE